MTEEPRNALLVLGLLIAALIPASIATAIGSQIPWYHGLSVFYGALAFAEIGYVTILVAMDRPRLSVS
ncbi:hypothetical protein [Methylobacterium sp. J-068]|uniref:hypothetical protein n=1 Tax=Methylobacterium sp. J-068 TaxID=2836649 RepID=UPI001FB8E6B3|nr:hypothetical protein [Methylobacterium sp. J-068]MCJ2033815.1 hypothetical protein [Methylobacterium sp. J-068]